MRKCKKVCHPTAYDARLAIFHMGKSNKLHTYWCDRCDAFHLSRQPSYEILVDKYDRLMERQQRTVARNENQRIHIHNLQAAHERLKEQYDEIRNSSTGRHSETGYSATTAASSTTSVEFLSGLDYATTLPQ